MRDVSGWAKIEDSTGSKVGAWLRDPEDLHQRWALVKFPREHQTFTRGEACAEHLAAMIGNALDLQMPETELVISNGRIAVLVWDFRPPGYELREGAMLTGSDPKTRILSVEEVRDGVAAVIGDNAALRFVTRMICFDILIANPDSHQSNWGAIQRPAGALRTMAPFFVNGAAFGSNLDPNRLRHHIESGWTTFDNGFRYQIAVSEWRPARIAELLDALSGWEGQLAGFADILEEFSDDDIDGLADAIPSEVIGDEQRIFAAALLRHRRDLIASR